MTPSAPDPGDPSRAVSPGEPVPAEPPSPPPTLPQVARSSVRDRVRPVAPVFDALLPGLGHLIAGRQTLAAVFGIPSLLLVALTVVLLASVSMARLAAEAINAFAVLFLLQGLVLAWRLLAVGTSLHGGQRADAAHASSGSTAVVAPPAGRQPVQLGPLRIDAVRVRSLIRPSGFRIGAVLLAGFVVAPQVWLGYVTNVAREEVDRVFSAAVIPDEPEVTFAPDPSALTTPEPVLETAAPTETPGPSPRLNVLLLGIDSGVGRNTALTDTMIVASLDPETATVSMISIPRDMVGTPLPDGRKFNQKINSLHAYARHNPRLFPGSDGTGNDVLAGALGTLLDLKIDYYASVNLPGFVKVVDAIGGVDVKVARAFCDPTYDEYGFTRGFSITAGWHHLNGNQALAYARVRKASGESDFTRAARQQEVIAGLRDGIVRRGLISDPVALLRALGQTLQTNVPRELLPDLADMMTRVDRTRTFRAVIEYPLIASGFDDRGSILIPDLKAIKALSGRLFPAPGQLPDLEYLSVPTTSTGTGGSDPNVAPPTGQPLTSGVKGCSFAPAPTRAPTRPPATAAPTVTSPPSPTATPTATGKGKPTPTPAPTTGAPKG